MRPASRTSRRCRGSAICCPRTPTCWCSRRWWRGARRFVGTYGGFAYLAPFYGVPAVSYYTDPGTFSVRHLDLAQHVFARSGGPGLLDVRQVPS